MIYMRYKEQKKKNPHLKFRSKLDAQVVTELVGGYTSSHRRKINNNKKNTRINILKINFLCNVSYILIPYIYIQIIKL